MYTHHELVAELAMVAWESTLPDPPMNHRVLIAETEITPESMERIKDFLEHQRRGGSKDQMLVIEGGHFEVFNDMRFVEDVT